MVFAVHCTPVFVVALLLAVAGSTVHIPAADPADGDVTDVRIIDELPSDGPYERIWQPFIARWTDRRSRPPPP